MRLEKIATKYHDQANFLCIYIKEAHPTDGSQSPPNIDEQILFSQPITKDERAKIAAVCMVRFNFSFPMVLDNMTNEVDSKFKAWPERLYVLDENGKVTWKCGIGPHFFDPTGFQEAVENLSRY